MNQFSNISGNGNDFRNAAAHASRNDEQVHLNIQVRDNNNKAFFDVKPNTKFGDIFNAFCARSGEEKNSCRFFFDGQRLLDDTTPPDIDMQDKDIIEVHQEQQGGSAGEENASPAASGEEPKAEPVHMNIKVVENQNEMFFKVKPNTKFRKIFDAYCGRTGKSRDSVRFLFEGERLLDENTPQDREMEDGDQIDVMQEQTGGASARDEASPSPPPRAPTALTPGPRASAFKALYDSTLSHTLRAITCDNFAACFPMIAENAPEQLKSIHKDLTERLDRFAKNEFETIIQERHVIANLNSLEDLIADAKRRKSRSTSTEDDTPPTPPHLLPAPAVASAHLSSLFASQQSQLNAKLQTVQSQNATLANTIAEQKSEIERLVAQLEAVVGDLDKANSSLEEKVGDLADSARKAEMELNAV